MQQKHVRTLFIAVCIFLPVQYGLVGIVGYYSAEPWPVFVFPGFKNAFIDQDSFEIDRTIFIASTDESRTQITLTSRELFPEIPNSQLAGFIRAHFWDDTQERRLSDSGLKWLQQQAKRASNQHVTQLRVVRSKEFWQEAPGNTESDSSKTIFEKTIYFEGDDAQ